MIAHLNSAARARVAKLLPLLSSDKVGEVAAAAAAIGRTLSAAGADWHELAAHVEHDPEPMVVYLDRPAARRQSSPTVTGMVYLDPARRDVIVNTLRRGRMRFALTNWEADFAASIIERLRTGRPSLTARQHEIVERLVAKITSRCA